MTPATGGSWASRSGSLRRVDRNFPGRGGTADDQVYLCSPTVAADAPDRRRHRLGDLAESRQSLACQDLVHAVAAYGSALSWAGHRTVRER